MGFDLTIVCKYYPFLLQGALLTFELAIIGISLGLLLGLLSSLMTLSSIKSFRLIAGFYVWIVRGTPLLVQLFLIYFGLPQLGINIDAFTSSILGLGINSGAYTSEIFRGGIKAVPNGQMEAARSLGMSYGLSFRRIILPQALKICLPSLGNQFIITLKDSSLCSVITMSELLQMSQRLASVNFAFIEFYLTAAVMYLMMTTVITTGLHHFEKRMAGGHKAQEMSK